MLTVDFHELKLKPGSMVLDAGCGSGRHLRGLANIQGVKYFGIDMKQEDLDKAKTSLAEIKGAVAENDQIIKADIRNLPFVNKFFDCVICSEVLEHINEHEQALKELVRVLKSNGSLVIQVISRFLFAVCSSALDSRLFDGLHTARLRNRVETYLGRLRGQLDYEEHLAVIFRLQVALQVFKRQP